MLRARTLFHLCPSASSHGSLAQSTCTQTFASVLADRHGSLKGRPRITQRKGHLCNLMHHHSAAGRKFKQVQTAHHTIKGPCRPLQRRQRNRRWTRACRQAPSKCLGISVLVTLCPCGTTFERFVDSSSLFGVILSGCRFSRLPCCRNQIASEGNCTGP